MTQTTDSDDSELQAFRPGFNFILGTTPLKAHAFLPVARTSKSFHLLTTITERIGIRRHERNNRLAREIVLRQKIVDGPGGLVPPDWRAHKDHVVAGKVWRRRILQLGMTVRVVMLFRDTARVITIIKICIRIWLSRCNLEKIRMECLRRRLGYGLRAPRRREIRHKDFFLARRGRLRRTGSRLRLHRCIRA